MLTNDDLSAIHNLIKEEVQGSEKRLTAKIDKVQETLTAKVDKVHETLTAKIDKVHETLTAKIDKVQEVVDVVQNVVVEHYGKLDQRVTNLEEELHIHKN